jgi:hypothetical protein
MVHFFFILTLCKYQTHIGVTSGSDHTKHLMVPRSCVEFPMNLIYATHYEYLLVYLDD